MGGEEEEVTEAESDSESGPPELDIDTLRRLNDDLRISHQEGLRNSTELVDKGVKVIQINGLILTILASISTQVEAAEFINFLTVISVGFFILSILLAGYSIRNRTVERGIGKESISTVIENQFSEKQYLLWANTRGYIDWMETTDDLIDARGRQVQKSIFSFILGVIALIAGTVLAMGYQRFLIITGIATGLLAGIVLVLRYCKWNVCQKIANQI